MTDTASPDAQDLAHFLQDWTTLWREEMLAHATDPVTLETWRTALALWASAALTPPSAVVRPRERPERRGPDPRPERPGTAAAAGPAGAKAAAAAPDSRDAAIERLVRRIDTLETRLASLEKPPGPGKSRTGGKSGKRAGTRDAGKSGGQTGSGQTGSGPGGNVPAGSDPG